MAAASGKLNLAVIIQALEKPSGAFKGMEKKMESMAKRSEAMGKKMMLAGAAVTAAFTGAVVAAAQFNKGMAEVSTLVDTAVVDMGKLKEGVNDVAAETGKSASDLTKGLYDLISAGVPAEDAITALGVAARLAVAGVTEASVAVDAMTAALNAFNIPASKAEHVADLFITAVEKGKTTLPELASSIGVVSSTAAGMGLTLEETLGIVASMTTVIGHTGRSVTGLQQILSNINKPGEQAAQMAASLGIEFNTSAMQAMGLAEFLNHVADAAGNDVTKLGQLFGSVEAVNGVLALTGKNAEGVAETLDAMGDAAGANAEKFAKMSAETAAAWDRTREKLAKLVRTIGDVLIPAVESLMKVLEPVINLFQRISESPIGSVLIKVAAAAGILAMALGGALWVVGKVSLMMPVLQNGLVIVRAAMSKLIPMVIAMGRAFLTFMLSPIGLVITALALMVKAIMFAFNEWKKMKQAVDEDVAAHQQLRHVQQKEIVRKQFKAKGREGETLEQFAKRAGFQDFAADEARRQGIAAGGPSMAGTGDVEQQMDKLIQQSEQMTTAMEAPTEVVAAQGVAPMIAPTTVMQLDTVETRLTEIRDGVLGLWRDLAEHSLRVQISPSPEFTARINRDVRRSGLRTGLVGT